MLKPGYILLSFFVFFYKIVIILHGNDDQYIRLDYDVGGPAGGYREPGYHLPGATHRHRRG